MPLCVNRNVFVSPNVAMATCSGSRTLLSHRVEPSTNLREVYSAQKNENVNSAKLLKLGVYFSFFY